MGRYYEERMVYPTHKWEQESWQDRVAAFLKTKDDPKRFNWPFPMGVFGTLRKGHGNSRLMHRADISSHRNAFLPHFYASGLRITSKENCCAPFEIYYYTPEEWTKMIYSVDCLESFEPERNHGGNNGNYYYRTLAWLRQIPEGQHKEWFEDHPNIWDVRDMKIEVEEWEKFEPIPCWIYSNMSSNKNVSKLDKNPIVWPVE